METNEDNSPTVFCGNLAKDVTEEMLYELFLQIAPLKDINIPFDGKRKRRANYAFITFKHAESVQYAIDMLDGISLFDKALKVKRRILKQNSGPLLVQNFQQCQAAAPHFNLNTVTHLVHNNLYNQQVMMNFAMLQQYHQYNSYNGYTNQYGPYM